MLHILTCLILCFTLISCKSIPPYNGALYESIAQEAQGFDTFTHVIDKQPLHGVHSGNSSNPAVIFIHGAPGDWKAWGEYIGDKELNEKAFLIAVDRPGFGFSGKQAETSLHKQAEIILKAALKEHKGPFILVGHSYGGPIQLQMAKDFPEHVAGAIILAGAIDPVAQKERWYHYLAHTWVARKALPNPINVTTYEMLDLPEQLHDLETHLSDIQIPVTVIQGDDDFLVPKINATYAKENLKDTKIIVLKNQGHFIPWEQYDLVKNEILSSLK